jgi:hypothetical protein
LIVKIEYKNKLTSTNIDKSFVISVIIIGDTNITECIVMNEIKMRLSYIILAMSAIE